jgi:hypothetical protein
LRARLVSAISVPVPETARYEVRTAIVIGAVCRVQTWVVREARRITENGAATSAPGRAANMVVNASPLRQARDQHVGGGSGRAAEEQHHSPRGDSRRLAIDWDLATTIDERGAGPPRR